jgi:hypothetical protein
MRPSKGAIDRFNFLKYDHWCGKQGYGMGINDVCPACMAFQLRTEGVTEIEIEKRIKKAVANVI